MWRVTLQGHIEYEGGRCSCMMWRNFFLWYRKDFDHAPATHSLPLTYHSPIRCHPSAFVCSYLLHNPDFYEQDLMKLKAFAGLLVRLNGFQHQVVDAFVCVCASLQCQHHVVIACFCAAHTQPVYIYAYVYIYIYIYSCMLSLAFKCA